MVRSSLMVRRVLWWVYGVQAAFLALVMAGMISRGEMSFWPTWRAAESAWANGLIFYIYGIFYSTFFVVPCLVISLSYPNIAARSWRHVPIAVWIMTTICFFHDAIFDALHDFFLGLNEYAPVWQQLSHILWALFTVFTVAWWRMVSKDESEHRIRKAVDEARNE